MEDFLLDRETLSQFVDELMKRRAIPVSDAGELNQFKEDTMWALDDHVTHEIFKNLSDSQTVELSELLDRESENPETFQNFFAEKGIDVSAIIASAVESFAERFLTAESTESSSEGGQNAL